MTHYPEALAVAPISEGMTAEDVVLLNAEYENARKNAHEQRRQSMRDLANSYSLRILRILATHAALAEKTAECERAWAEYDRMKADRAAVLNVKTTDGLTSSEWLMRTALAERERDSLHTALAEAQADSAKLREAVAMAVVCQAELSMQYDGETRIEALNGPYPFRSLADSKSTEFYGGKDEHPADALLRWHASRQPDPAPGGTENGR